MRKKKRLISLLLAVFIAVACLPAGIARADKPRALSLSLTAIRRSWRYTYWYRKDKQYQDFAGFQVNIVYDPKVLMAVDPETGKEFTSSTFPPDALY